MKKLNRKGFTLVELLAVIVILAIIVGLVFPQVMNAMDNSRVSAIHSSAKGVVKWWDNAKVADSLVPESQKQIPSAMLTQVTSSGWKCMSEITDNGKNLFELAGLSKSDLNFDKVTEGGATAYPSGIGESLSVTSKTCSAVRLDSAGGLEVVLVAKDGGRYYISGKTTFAYSKLDAGKSS